MMKDKFEWDVKSPKSNNEKPNRPDDATRHRILKDRADAIKPQLELKLSESAERCDFTDAQLNELSAEYENLLLDISELENALLDENGEERN